MLPGRFNQVTHLHSFPAFIQLYRYDLFQPHPKRFIPPITSLKNEAHKVKPIVFCTNSSYAPRNSHLVTAETSRQECDDLLLPLLSLTSLTIFVLLIFSPSLVSNSTLRPLQELLAELKPKHGRNPWLEKLRRLMVHCLAWLICIAVTTSCVIGIYYFSDFMHRVRINGLFSFLLSLTHMECLICDLSLLNLGKSETSCSPGSQPVGPARTGLPHQPAAAWPLQLCSLGGGLYVSFCAHIRWSQPVRVDVEHRNNVCLIFNLCCWCLLFLFCRNLMLKVSVLGVLCYHWLVRIATDRTDYIKVTRIKCISFNIWTDSYFLAVETNVLFYDNCAFCCHLLSAGRVLSVRSFIASSLWISSSLCWILCYASCCGGGFSLCNRLCIKLFWISFLNF